MYPSVTDMLSPQFPEKRWTKAEHYNSVSIRLFHKQRPRHRGVSRVIDRRPGLKCYSPNVIRLLGGK